MSEEKKVEQDERGAFIAWHKERYGYWTETEACKARFEGWQARAASTSANVLDRVTSILASEIECSLFEKHVAPALDLARKVLAGDPQ